MNDNEIIKALECCVADDVDCCNECPILYCNEDLDNCETRVHKEALDLIKRQEAELADERAKIGICAETISRQDVEIERLTDRNRRLGDDMSMMLNNDNGAEQIKSEAIKEFAERLKEKIDGDVHTSEGFYFMVTDAIDNIVKEMVGE